MTHELTEAVDALSKISITYIDTDTGPQPVTALPLLDQLEAAIGSSMNSGSGGGGLPSQRNVLDSRALYRAVLIKNQIGDWLNRVSVKVPRNATLATRLDTWAYAYLAHTTDTEHPYHVGKLTEWRDDINRMLNPPHTREITDPCPTCGAGTWENEEGETRAHPIVLDVDAMSAECRACGETWTGEIRLRALRWDMDVKTPAES